MNSINEQIIQLSNITFGKAYLSEALLKKFAQTSSCKLVVLQEEGKLLGFSIIHLMTLKELQKHLFMKESWIETHFGKFNRIGYRKMTAIQPSYSGVGIGRKLYQEGEKWFNGQQAEAVLSAVWTHNGKSPMATILQKEGYSKLATVPQYWKQDSLNRNFECAECGNPPCLCEATLYAKFNL